MRRSTLCLAVLFSLFSAAPAFAQFDLVTGQVLDPNGFPYSGATLKAQLTINGSNVTGQPTVTVTSQAQCTSAGAGTAPCQVPFPGTVGPVTLDANGNIPGGGINLADNPSVTPAGTQWTFSVTISPGALPPLGTGPQSFSLAITINANPKNVGGLLSAVAPKLSNISGGGGGGGTVTSVSSGNFSPLFTTSVATASSTPALSFTGISQNANLFFAGPATGSAALPTFRAMVAADLAATVSNCATGSFAIGLNSGGVPICVATTGGTQTIASGTSQALTNATILSGACLGTVISAPGVLATDMLDVSGTQNPPSVYSWLNWSNSFLSANTVNIIVCNPDSSSAHVTTTNAVNWIVLRPGSGGGGSGVSSLNTLTGAVTLAAGSGVTLTPSGNTITIASTGGGGAVSSVSNSDGSLVISPTTGTVVASLNPANANTWTALQTFGTNISIGGVTPTGATGTGNAVFSSSPTLTTPALGTPSALVLSNATGLPFTAITSGTNSVAAMLCNTGCSIGTSGSGTVAATSISNTTVTPGNYTSTNLTVGADGRITAASNGGLTTPSSLNILNFGAFWNSKSINTATFTNGSPNVSTTATGTFQCPGSAFPCSSGGDVGKSSYGYADCNTGTIPAGQGTALPFGTIVTVTDAQHIVVSVNATSTPTAGQACFYWGNPDDAAATAMDAAAVASNVCPTETLPSGGGMFTQAHFISAIPACSNSSSGLGGALAGWGEVITGQGKGGTVVFLAPSLATTNSASCIGGQTGIACFGGQPGQSFRAFSFDGGGDYATGFASHHNVIEFNAYSNALDWSWINYGASDGNAFLLLDGSYFESRGSTFVGMPQIVTGAGGRYSFVQSSIQEGCALHVFSMGSATSDVAFSDSNFSLGPCGGTNQIGILDIGLLNISNSLLFIETNPISLNLINVQGTGVLRLSQDYFQTGTQTGTPLNLAVSGATVYASQTILNGGSSGTVSVVGVAGASFIDQGGNSTNKPFSGAFTVYGSASITGSPLVTGNVVLTSGWGSGAAASVFSGNSQASQWTSTIGTTPSTTAVTTVTFPTPFFSAPTCTAIINGGTSTAALQASCSATATAATITYLGTLVSGTVITTLRASN